ncbi:MAG: type II/IV secretion system protein [Bdellovibrionaceae bacterium]|nr:type II/IV secretion system protein [Pseudobdellovibrionaceae bacterium]
MDQAPAEHFLDLNFSGIIDDAPRAADYILYLALKKEASDIHVEVNKEAAHLNSQFLVRLRINGVLYNEPMDRCRSVEYRELISRFKFLAKMDPTQTRTPDDGSIFIKAKSGDFKLRVSTVPGLHLEDIVMRIQASGQQVRSMDQILMTRSMKKQLELVLSQSSGLIVITGPTGSGKTTTLYAMLSVLAAQDKKVITAEDPVEVEIRGVNHYQVSQHTNFAKMAKAFMRQDADIILIGEVRDEETAEVVMQLAQTGHLVLTTLHTRNAIETLTRLDSLGVSRDLVASSLNCSIAQRLVKGLCQYCKVEEEPDEDDLENIYGTAGPPEGANFFGPGDGCEQCTHGYSGRVPLFETFVVDNDISEQIMRGKSTDEITKFAVQKGMMTLKEDALLRVYRGLTDLDSVLPYVIDLTY